MSKHKSAKVKFCAEFISGIYFYVEKLCPAIFFKFLKSTALSEKSIKHTWACAHYCLNTIQAIKYLIKHERNAACNIHNVPNKTLHFWRLGFWPIYTWDKWNTNIKPSSVIQYFEKNSKKYVCLHKNKCHKELV